MTNHPCVNHLEDISAMRAKLKLNPKLIKEGAKKPLPPIIHYTPPPSMKIVDWREVDRINRQSFGTFDYIEDPKFSDPLYKTNKLKGKDREKKIVSNIWKWVNHASRLQFLESQFPYRRMLCIKLSSICGDKIPEITQPIHNALLALSVASTKLGLRLVLYIDVNMENQDVRQLSYLHSIFKIVNKYRTKTIGLYSFVNEGFEHTNLSYLTPILETVEEFEICIDMNIRCCPHYSLLIEDSTKVSDILKSGRYSSWVKECWESELPVLWVEQDKFSHIKKLVRLGQVIVI
jgi:hypothetical protein